MSFSADFNVTLSHEQPTLNYLEREPCKQGRARWRLLKAKLALLHKEQDKQVILEEQRQQVAARLFELLSTGDMEIAFDRQRSFVN